MVTEKKIQIAGKDRTVVISDEREALLAADAAGRAVIGIWREGTDLPRECLYLVEDPEDVTEDLLRRAVLRKLGMPWKIGETERLIIREFSPEDPVEAPSPWDCGVFSDREKRDAYIRNQYRFAERGLWALVRKKDGAIVGKAGITGDELGYHIYPAYRKTGYALEACRAIMTWAEKMPDLSKLRLRIPEGNRASEELARKLGFRRAPEKEDGMESWVRDIAKNDE